MDSFFLRYAVTGPLIFFLDWMNWNELFCIFEILILISNFFYFFLNSYLFLNVEAPFKCYNSILLIFPFNFSLNFGWMKNEYLMQFEYPRHMCRAIVSMLAKRLLSSHASLFDIFSLMIQTKIVIFVAMLNLIAF